MNSSVPTSRISRITSGTSGLSPRNRPRRVGRGSSSRPRIARMPPSITTPTMIVPSTMVVTLGSTEASVRSIRTSRRMKTARIGPEEPADAAAEHDAAQHHRRDGGQQVGPGDRLADAGRHGQRQPAHAPRTGRRARRPRPASGRSRRRTGRRPAGPSPRHRSTGPSRERRSGSQTASRQTIRKTSAFGTQGTQAADDQPAQPGRRGAARARAGSGAPRPPRRTASRASRRCRAPASARSARR